MVTALAQESLRQDGAALLALTRALQAAETEGWVRPFLRDRDRLTPLLERYRTVVMTPSPLVDRLLTPSTSRAVHQVALTDRELAVLQLLPSMMSNEQIARELFVSVNTVKVHLKSLYRKLGVTSRREAVIAGAAWAADQVGSGPDRVGRCASRSPRDVRSGGSIGSSSGPVQAERASFRWARCRARDGRMIRATRPTKIRSRKIWIVTTSLAACPVAWTSPKPTVAMVDIVK